MHPFRFLSIVTVSLLLLTPLRPADACTAFAANGDGVVQGGGSLIAKVRDEIMTRQIVKTVYPDKGYAYTGLFNGKREIFNMGINEKGFVVFRTTAGSIPKKERKRFKRFKSDDGLAGQEFLIRYSASVDEALRHVAVFEHEPTNYVMADAREVAFVEVLPGGIYSVTRRKNGVLSHTNHYISEGGTPYNKRIGSSSLTRLQRIQALLNASDKPFALDDFVAFTRDQNDGPNRSIFRTPEKETVSGTLSMMVVHIPVSGTPELYLKWRDSREDKTSWQEIRHPVRFELE